jgi:hypothetical protein
MASVYKEPGFYSEYAYPYQIKDVECNRLAYAKSYVTKFEKHVLEWEHDTYTQVEINDIIEELVQ